MALCIYSVAVTYIGGSAAHCAQCCSVVTSQSWSLLEQSLFGLSYCQHCHHWSTAATTIRPCSQHLTLSHRITVNLDHQTEKNNNICVLGSLSYIQSSCGYKHLNIIFESLRLTIFESQLCYWDRSGVTDHVLPQIFF